MSTNREHKTYEQITRETVPEPDGGWRPSDQQEIEAFEGFRALDEEEQVLSDRIDAALAAGGRDLEHVEVEVEHNQVTLRGNVKDAAAGAYAEKLVREVEGVHSVIDRLVIAW
jgi:hypothetical protein